MSSWSDLLFVEADALACPKCGGVQFGARVELARYFQTVDITADKIGDPYVSYEGWGIGAGTDVVDYVECHTCGHRIEWDERDELPPIPGPVVIIGSILVGLLIGVAVFGGVALGRGTGVPPDCQPPAVFPTARLAPDPCVQRGPIR